MNKCKGMRLHRSEVGVEKKKQEKNSSAKLVYNTVVSDMFL